MNLLFNKDTWSPDMSIRPLKSSLLSSTSVHHTFHHEHPAH